MKLIIILSVCVIACTAEYYTLPKDDYTPEALDREEIKRRLECYLDKQPCTVLTAEHKKIADDALKTSCAKCPPELKVMAHAFMTGAKEHYPEDYKELILKYDPTVKRFNALEESVGVLKTIIAPFTSLPSIPSISSIPLIPSLPKL